MSELVKIVTQKDSLRRDRDSGDLPRSLVPLIKVKEGVGEVDHVFVAVDVGHSGKAEEEMEKQSSINGRQWRHQRPNHKTIYISKTGLQSSDLSPTDLTRTPICPSCHDFHPFYLFFF